MDWADRVGRRIKLRDLHLVLAVADTGSMSRAASQLGVSHPVVSKSISDLERSLGVSLFDRNSQGVELTSYGRALVECGTVVFDEMRHSLQRIETLARPDTGELRIGCPEVIAAGIMPAIAQQLSKRHPRIRLHVVHANTAMREFQQLRERKVDLLLGRSPKPHVDDDLICDTLFDEPFVAVGGLARKKMHQPGISLADLLKEPWILPPYDSVPGSLIAQMFRAERLAPPLARIVTLSVQLTTALISTGLFVGILPRSVVAFCANRRALKVLPVKLPPQRISVDIITLRNRTLTPVAERFVDSAREVARSIRELVPAEKIGVGLR